jgi:hypothetical protein
MHIVDIRPHKKKIGDRPRPCLNGPDPIFLNFLIFQKVFSSLFHILMWKIYFWEYILICGPFKSV